MIAVSLDEIYRYRGRNLGSSPWVEISQQRINDFADATNDHQWIHVDPIRSGRGPFGSTIAHGFLLLSLVPALCNEVVTISGSQQSLNYGVERVRFVSPVLAGSLVRANIVLSDVAQKGDSRVLVVFSFVLEIQGQAKPGVVGDLILMKFRNVE